MAEASDTPGTTHSSPMSESSCPDRQDGVDETDTMADMLTHTGLDTETKVKQMEVVPAEGVDLPKQDVSPSSDIKETKVKQMEVVPEEGVDLPKQGVSPSSDIKETAEGNFVAVPVGTQEMQDIHLTAEGEVLKFPGQECRIVLMGKTGNGKSSTGNNILNLTTESADGCFLVGNGLSSTTKQCTAHEITRFRIKLMVVDTPGIFDTENNNEYIRDEISKCIGIASPGPHALLLIIRLDARFTKEEVDSLDYLTNLFDQDILKYLIIVFTHSDHLPTTPTESSGVDEVFKTLPISLKEILKKVGDRYVIFDNMTKDQAVKDAQIRQLLIKIRDMLSLYGDKHFENPLLAECEIVLQRYRDALRKMLDDTSSTTDIREHLRAALESQTKYDRILISKWKKETEKHERRQEDSGKLIEQMKRELQKTVESAHLQKKKHDREMQELQKEIETKMEKQKELENKLSENEQNLTRLNSQREEAEKTHKQEVSKYEQSLQDLKKDLQDNATAQSQLEKKLEETTGDLDEKSKSAAAEAKRKHTQHVLEQWQLTSKLNETEQALKKLLKGEREAKSALAQEQNKNEQLRKILNAEFNAITVYKKELENKLKEKTRELEEKSKLSLCSLS